MKAYLNIFRFFSLLVFGMALLLLLVTLMNFFFGFSRSEWFRDEFIRLYLFFTVTGILGYILITFRRRKG